MKRLILVPIVIPFVLMISFEASSQLSDRAPDVLPGTLPEMRTASYWVARMDYPDEVLLSTVEILRRNEQYHKKIADDGFFANIPDEKKSKLEHYFPGIALRVPDLRSVSPEALADTVRYHIGIEIDYIRSGDYGNSNNVRYAEWEIDDLVKEMALDRLGNRTVLRDAIAVSNTHLKNAPAFFPEMIGFLNRDGRPRLDLWDISILKIGKPVEVLHVSRSGEFVFVLCEIGFGWVRSEDVAFAGRRYIDEFINADNFIVCTGDRIQFYSDESCAYSSGWLRMGDRIPLVKKGDRRLIKVPVRKTDASFATETAWLPDDADVSIGYLPYTRRNIVVTALKLLDNPYDFTGTFFGRQHETTYRDIFSCFGFDLPYHGGLFTHYGNNNTVLDPAVGRSEQYRTILGFEPFVTVMITLQDRGGHAQLLLGEHDGVPVVFDQHGYGYTDENGKELIIRRCCIGKITMPEYFLKRKLTFLVLK